MSKTTRSKSLKSKRYNNNQYIYQFNLIKISNVYKDVDLKIDDPDEDQPAKSIASLLDDDEDEDDDDDDEDDDEEDDEDEVKPKKNNKKL